MFPGALELRTAPVGGEPGSARWAGPPTPTPPLPPHAQPLTLDTRLTPPATAPRHTIPQTQPEMCTHGSSGGHAIPGAQRTTVLSHPQLHRTEKHRHPPNTHSRTDTHTQRARSLRTPVHTPALPAVQLAAPSLPAPAQDTVRRLPEPKFGAAALLQARAAARDKRAEAGKCG